VTFFCLKNAIYRRDLSTPAYSSLSIIPGLFLTNSYCFHIIRLINQWSIRKTFVRNTGPVPGY